MTKTNNGLSLQINSIIFFLFVLLIVGCGPNYIFEEEKNIEAGKWSYDNQLEFNIDIQDTSAIYNLYLDIDHTTDYQKQNLYLMIHTSFPNGEKIEERISIDLADKMGKWQGDCNAKNCELRVTIQEGAYFNALGKHTITVEQFMRIDPLEGIKGIALKIEDTGNRR